VRFLVELHARPLRRSCEMVDLSKSAWYAPPLNWTLRDAELIAALGGLVEQQPTRGFGKCCQLLAKTHPHWNAKRIYRVYCAMKHNLRRAAKRRLPKRDRVPLYVSEYPDTVWSADLMLDALQCGRSFRTFNITDDFNRELIYIEIDTSLTSQRLVRIFERIRQEPPLPQVLRTDSGPKFLGEVFVERAKQHGMAIQYIQPGKPNQDAYIEHFNRTYREEVLDQYLFARLKDVREATWRFLIDYNEHRPYDALGGMTLAEYRNHHEAESSTFDLSA